MPLYPRNPSRTVRNVCRDLSSNSSNTSCLADVNGDSLASINPPTGDGVSTGVPYFFSWNTRNRRFFRLRS